MQFRLIRMFEIIPHSIENNLVCFSARKFYYIIIIIIIAFYYKLFTDAVYGETNYRPMHYYDKT